MNLSDLPDEILEYIITLIDTTKNDLMKGGYIRERCIDIAIKNKVSMVSPQTLSILSRVSTSFRKEFIHKKYWGDLIIRDVREGLPYKTRSDKRRGKRLPKSKRIPKAPMKYYMNKIIVMKINDDIRRLTDSSEKDERVKMERILRMMGKRKEEDDEDEEEEVVEQLMIEYNALSCLKYII